MPTQQRYKLTIAYRGTRYHGWQAQPVAHGSHAAAAAAAAAPADEQSLPPVPLEAGPHRAEPQPHPRPSWHARDDDDDEDLADGGVPSVTPYVPTIQGEVTRALEAILGHGVELVGSSRTDAGVHAKGQIAHFDTPMTQIPPDRLRKAANDKLPADILIRKLEPVADSFDALVCTASKRYQYLIWNHRERPVLFCDLAWHRWQYLDVPKMAEAAGHFVGEHDFASFCRPGHGRAHTTRTVYACDVVCRGPRIIIGVEGRGFLWNMVRIMVGTLMHVGIGRIGPEAIVTMLAAKNRQASGPTAPAHGLYLQWIKMKPPEEWAAAVAKMVAARAGDGAKVQGQPSAVAAAAAGGVEKSEGPG